MNYYSHQYNRTPLDNMLAQKSQTITVHKSTPGQNRRGPWSPEEDRKLMELISIFGPSNWVRISNTLNTRTPKQCRERYHQNLKPLLNRTPITNEEGELIEKLVAKYGKKWAEIARHPNGRSDNAIKNWWNGGANRRRRASSQTGVKDDESISSRGSVSSELYPQMNKALPNTKDDIKDDNNSNKWQQPDHHHQHQPPLATPHPSTQTLPQISFKTSMFGTGAPEVASKLDTNSQVHQIPNHQTHPSLPVHQIHPFRLASFDVHLQGGLPHFSNLLPTNPSGAQPSIAPLQSHPGSNHPLPPHPTPSLALTATTQTTTLSTAQPSGVQTSSQPSSAHHLHPHILLPTKRRLLDVEANLITRRHSTANTIYSASLGSGYYTNSNPNLSQTTPMHMSSSNPGSTGNVSPYYGSPLLLGHQPSRNNSISHFEFSTLATSSNNSSTGSRRSSIAPDFFPNPLKDVTLPNNNNPTQGNSNSGINSSPHQHKRNISQNSFNSSSISASGRISFSAPSIVTNSLNGSGSKLPSVHSSINNMFKPLPPIPSEIKQQWLNSKAGSIETEMELDNKELEKPEGNKTKMSVSNLMN